MVDNKHFPVYFKQPYLDSQQYLNLKKIQTKHFCLIGELKKNELQSLPRSPFGGIFLAPEVSNAEESIQSLKSYFADNSINQVAITNPPPIYKHFVSGEVLMRYGFTLTLKNINQHIELNNFDAGKLHKMEQRKLRSLESGDFLFRKLPTSMLDEVYSFLLECRIQQGLSINIEREHLKYLAATLPSSYEFFGIFLGKKLISALIVVKVMKTTVYYYLPGTAPSYKKNSPMVLLLFKVAQYYKKQGFKYLDLGLSSINGIKQAGLFDFKERMGAEALAKVTYQLRV